MTKSAISQIAGTVVLMSFSRVEYEYVGLVSHYGKSLLSASTWV